ncbi:alkaline phosphatase PhoX [Parafrankia elaeagni]|uniref:alkaline phosphatase PhoX n=1 Tax=Parafrankia elaeagni TaxID=222534 RepID=UPI000375DEF1|nr:alkaline phosphatase PhoX [Parafrankia elaeagni]
MDRRALLRLAAAGVGTTVLCGTSWQSAVASTTQPGQGPYGPLRAPDSNGVALPPGFTSRVVARSREIVPGTGLSWHDAPDGGACFPAGNGWIYVSNSETALNGGASALRFDPAGTIISASRILRRTNANCAGGATPWGTWLSCEEYAFGRVHETWPDGSRPAVARPAMGRFTHEAAACDPDRQVVYLTEDRRDGCFYRFRPTRWGDLSDGTLEVLRAPADAVSGPVTWAPVPDPGGFPRATRRQVDGARAFDGGEGCYYAAGRCLFTTKGDNRIWAYDAVGEQIALLHDPEAVPRGGMTMTGVDNITGSARGDLFVAEDRPGPALNLITPGGTFSRFLQLPGHQESEITGPAFSPDGRRLYVSSQRGAQGRSRAGITFEITGPFRG